MHGHMKAVPMDAFRGSLSSAVSSSSQGSGNDGGVLGGGTLRVGSSFDSKIDYLLPKALVCSST